MNRPSSANAALAASAPRVRSSASGPSASRPPTSRWNRSVPPSWAVHRRIWDATSPSCRWAETCPRWAASRSVSWYPSSAAGTAASRWAMLRCASSPSVGIRSRMPRTFCSGPAVTDTWLDVMPASAISTLRPSRSTKASWASCSRSSTGTAARAAASALPVEVDPLGEPRGREVRQPVVVPGDAGVGRHGRVEGSGVLDVLVGDRVDLAWCAHAATLGSALTPIRQRSRGS